MVSQKQILGYVTILLIIGSGATYFYFNDQVALRIDEDKSVFYTNIDGRFLISAQQNDRIFSGTKIVDRVKKTISLTNYTEGKIYVKQRETTYENNERIVHTWKFNPYSAAIEDFPLIETICIYNAKDKFYRYSLDKLVDAGPKRKLTTETSAEFGRNMKISFQPGYRWAWIGYPYGSDSFAVQYDIKSNEECFAIRLFDPIPVNLFIDGYQRNIKAELGTHINLTANVTTPSEICIDVDHPEGGINVSCGTATAYFNQTISYFYQEGFNDSTTIKNLTVNGDYNNGSVCYQEFANVSTICGGLDSGVYSYAGTYLTNIDNWNDGNWSSYFYSSGGAGTYMYVNYTIPYWANKTTSTWKLGTASTGWINTSVDPDASCWNRTDGNLILRIHSDYYDIKGYCQDDPGTWHLIFSEHGNPVATTEEGMQWYFLEGGDSTTYFSGHEHDDVVNLSFYVKGYQIQGNYPTSVVVFVNGTETNNIPIITASEEGQITDLASGDSTGLFEFESVNTTTNDEDVGVFYGSTITTNLTFDVTGVKINKTCFQESATVSNQRETDTQKCGLLYTGNYAWSSGFLSTGTTNDGYYNLANIAATYPATTYMYINYTIPPGATGATAIYKITELFEDTIPADCLTTSTLESRIRFENYQGAEYYCKGSGGTWTSIRSTSYYLLYEEAIEWQVETGYPADLWMDVGDIDATKEWNYTGEFSTTETVNISLSLLQDYMLTCTFEGGVCDIPIWISSGEDGGVFVDSLAVNYTNIINPITIEGSYIETYLRAQSGYASIPISFTSDTSGIIEVSNLTYRYKGGNQTVEVKAHEPDYATNLTYNITYFYSKYNRTLPYDWTNTIFFQPKAYDTKNVSAYYQNPNRAILNFTSYTRGHDFNITAQINETSSCLNLTISLNSSKSAGTVITNTTGQYLFKQNTSENIYLWTWADLYECDSSVKRYLQPNYIFTSCCSECEVCP